MQQPTRRRCPPAPLHRHSVQSPTALVVVEAVECPARSPSNDSVLASATTAIPTKSQSMTRAEITATTGKTPGDKSYQLVGTGVFHPSRQLSHRFMVKGVRSDSVRGGRVNITSHQSIGDSCG